MYNELNNLQKQIHKARVPNKESKIFIGDADMFPQVQTGLGWRTQTVNGQEYFLENGLWYSSQLFVHKIQFTTNRDKAYKKFYLDLLDHCYIESVNVLCEFGPTVESIMHTLTLGAESVVETMVASGLINLDFYEILLPADKCVLKFNVKSNNVVEVNYALEVKYRTLL